MVLVDNTTVVAGAVIVLVTVARGYLEEQYDVAGGKFPRMEASKP